MNLFAVVLLMLVGVVFVLSPAGLLAGLTSIDLVYWIMAIFAYYILATIVPIDQIIGRLYPIFGGLLIFMSIGLIVGLIVSGKGFYHTGMDFSNLHPTELPLWPLLFITIACGAVSGFHATQSPLMARCMQNEKSGRAIFYGAMIGEGIIALIWCTLGLSFYESPEALNAVLSKGGPSAVVHEVSTSLLGTVGGILAILGVVILPITSGDTAFRSARLVIADFMKLDQKPMAKRLLIAIPMFVLGYVISKADFDVIWRYFGLANQATAAIMLWAASAYLIKEGKLHWIATLPAMFMTAVCFTFLGNAGIGFGLPMNIATILGVGATALMTLAFLIRFRPARLSAAKES
jgi:carbon starvation protein CstA